MEDPIINREWKVESEKGDQYIIVPESFFGDDRVKVSKNTLKNPDEIIDYYDDDEEFGFMDYGPQKSREEGGSTEFTPIVIRTPVNSKEGTVGLDLLSNIEKNDNTEDKNIKKLITKN